MIKIYISLISPGDSYAPMEKPPFDGGGWASGKAEGQNLGIGWQEVQGRRSNRERKRNTIDSFPKYMVLFVYFYG